MSVTLAESVATVGAWLNCPGQGGVRCHHQRRSPYAQAPRRPPTAAGTPDYIDHEKQTWKIEIRDENGRRVCVSRCTLNVVDLDSAFVENGDRSA